MKPPKISSFKVFSSVILALLTVLFIFPFYWILTGAFKSQPDSASMVATKPDNRELPAISRSKSGFAVDVEQCLHFSCDHVLGLCDIIPSWLCFG